MKTALLLIAHGSRRGEANQDLFHLADQLRASFAIVEPAFLELTAPSISAAARRCVEEGARRVVLVPYFLSAGVHVRRDLQEAQAALRSGFPQTEFVLANPLGPHPSLTDLVSLRVQEALSNSPSTPQDR